MSRTLRTLFFAISLYASVGAYGQANTANEPPTKFSGQIGSLELPIAPDGFSWRRIEAIDVAVLVPKKWSQHQKGGPSYKVFAFSDQPLDAQNHFERGLSVFLYWHPQGAGNEERAVDAVLVGLLQSIQANKQHNTILQQSLSAKNGKKVLIVRHRNAPPNEVPIVVHSMYIGDPRTGLVYQFMFEAPEISWDAEWQTGQAILKDVRIAFQE